MKEDKDIAELMKTIHTSYVGKLTEEQRNLMAKMARITLEQIKKEEKEKEAAMTDRELLDLIATQVCTLTKDMGEVKGKITKIETNMEFVKGTVVKIETEHGQKLGVLADGYKLNAEKLDRIEKEVTRH